MNSYGSRMLGQLVRAGLSTRLVVGLVAVIFLTVAAIALPAYTLVRTELERQAWSRVEQGATSSVALLNAGQAQLDQLTTLAAQRPTLRSILHEGNRQALGGYLTTFAEGAGVDRFLLWSPKGDLLAGAAIPGLGWDEAMAIGTGGFVAGGDAGPVGILSTEQVADASGSTLGTLALIHWLDADALLQLKSETGLDQSILVDGVRQATTLIEAEAGTRIHRPETDRLAAIDIGGKPFYRVTTPVGDSQGRVVLETALGIESIRQRVHAPPSHPDGAVRGLQ